MRERTFKKFISKLIVELSNNDFMTQAHFYLCQSFYDIFIGAFQLIPFPDTYYYSDEEEKDYILNYKSTIRHKNYKSLSGKQINALNKLIKNVSRFDSASISTTRGHAYMIFENEDGKRKNEDVSQIAIHSSCCSNPRNIEERVPRFIINQLTTKVYVILPLKDIVETKFNPNNFRYSFGIPSFTNEPNHTSIGDIFFFNESGIEFSRINIVDVINSNKDIIKDLDNKIRGLNSSTLNIELFQEDSFIYAVRIHQKEHVVNRRRTIIDFRGKVDLKENHWINAHGHSYFDSSK